jgi:hypothetical protein
MTHGDIRAKTIAPDMLASTFAEAPGHATLGAEFGIATARTPELGRSLAELPVGSKVFVSRPEHLADPAYDEVGMMLGHTAGRAQIISLAPKNGGKWGVHTAYGEPASEIPDAIAALDRLFDPQVEFGSIAVLSETTGRLLGADTSTTIGTAGCNSHEPARLASTLSLSQLLDNYRWKATALLPASQLVRRDSDGLIVHLLPGQAHSQQPGRELRDQRSMLDRIRRLAGRDSELYGLTPAAILRGIETAVSKGVFTDQQASVSAAASTIRKGAERLLL